MTAVEIKKSMDRLKVAYATPTQPLGLESKKLVDGLPPVPADVFAFTEAYGSGHFENGGLFLTVLNPYEQGYWVKQNRDLKLLRDMKKTEGDDYVPYGIWPERPGLFLWGYGQDRKHFFWLTEGDPASWPVVVMYDIEIFTQFEMSMVQFLEQLLCGELDCSFIGGVDSPDNRIDPTTLRFVPGILP